MKSHKQQLVFKVVGSNTVRYDEIGCATIEADGRLVLSPNLHTPMGIVVVFSSTGNICGSIRVSQEGVPALFPECKQPDLMAITTTLASRAFVCFASELQKQQFGRWAGLTECTWSPAHLQVYVLAWMHRMQERCRAGQITKAEAEACGRLADAELPVLDRPLTPDIRKLLDSFSGRDDAPQKQGCLASVAIPVICIAAVLIGMQLLAI